MGFTVRVLVCGVWGSRLRFSSLYMVVKTMVPSWVPIIIRHLLFRLPQKGTVILTTTPMGVQRVSSNSEGPWVLTISTGFHLGFHRISVAMFLGFSGLENPPKART